MSDGYCILTRKNSQAVIVFDEDGKEVEVRVVGVRDGQVRLGFKADQSFNFVREELLDGE